jgi:hypothetical protein
VSFIGPTASVGQRTANDLTIRDQQAIMRVIN